MIRILVAEDSNVVAMLLRSVLEQEPDMNVVGRARDGREAVLLAQELKPDLITMDVRMPVMDGFEATRMIMGTSPCPIVVVSARVDDPELRTTFRAIEEGALAVLERLRPGHPDFKTHRRELVSTVRAMADVKVVTRRGRGWPKQIFEAVVPRQTAAHQIVGIGCSTGGPQALRRILSDLPVGFPIPIVVAQHISRGFIGGVAEWLRGHTMVDVKVVMNSEPLKPATAYFAPDDRHLLVGRSHRGICARLVDGPPVSRFRPSASLLLSSIAQVCPGGAIGILLTGMGEDGGSGLLAMRQAKCHTIVQDEESSIVYGMPRTALSLDAVDRVVKLDRMAAYLVSQAKR